MKDCFKYEISILESVIVEGLGVKRANKKCGLFTPFFVKLVQKAKCCPNFTNSSMLIPNMKQLFIYFKYFFSQIDLQISIFNIVMDVQGQTSKLDLYSLYDL